MHERSILLPPVHSFGYEFYSSFRNGQKQSSDQWYCFAIGQATITASVELDPSLPSTFLPVARSNEQNQLNLAAFSLLPPTRNLHQQTQNAPHIVLARQLRGLLSILIRHCTRPMIQNAKPPCNARLPSCLCFKSIPSKISTLLSISIVSQLYHHRYGVSHCQFIQNSCNEGGRAGVNGAVLPRCQLYQRGISCLCIVRAVTVHQNHSRSVNDNVEGEDLVYEFCGDTGTCAGK